jgi:hypothetical protein
MTQRSFFQSAMKRKRSVPCMHHEEFFPKTGTVNDKFGRRRTSLKGDCKTQRKKTVRMRRKLCCARLRRGLSCSQLTFPGQRFCPRHLHLEVPEPQRTVDLWRQATSVHSLSQARKLASARLVLGDWNCIIVLLRLCNFVLCELKANPDQPHLHTRIEFLTLFLESQHGHVPWSVWQHEHVGVRLHSICQFYSKCRDSVVSQLCGCPMGIPQPIVQEICAYTFVGMSLPADRWSSCHPTVQRSPSKHARTDVESHSEEWRIQICG